LRLLKPVRRLEHMINGIKDYEMKLSFRRWTFPQRFARILIFFGVPALCLEFIEIPRSAWGTVLVLLVPAMIAALFVVAIIEQLLSSRFAESA
jgi:hypothetical protein